MGTFGYLLSSRSVFIVTFILAIPALLSLARIREREVDATHAHGAVKPEVDEVKTISVLSLLRQHALLIFAGSILLLQLANAAMLPLMAGIVTTRSSRWAPVLIAACIVVPQITVLAVMVPLIVADVACGSGHFNLAQGIVGTATGIGASLSTVLAGYVSDKFGHDFAFIGLACIAALGLAMIWLVMPETRREAPSTVPDMMEGSC
jgi:hypothetical protein